MKTIPCPIRLPLAIALFTLLAVPISQVHAAVANVASLQGSLLEDGSAELVSATPMSILWTEKSSIDPTAFDHSLEDATKLVVQKDGDYLVAATVPLISIDTADNRPSQVIEIYVNGEPVPGTVGQSSYIRNQPRNANMHQESSDHVHALLTGLSANDVIELRVHKHTRVTQATGIQTASLYAELIDGSRTVFAGLSSGPTQGTSLNPDFFDAGEPLAELAWTSTRKDAGFNHANGSGGIGLSAGTYLVFVNVPLSSGVQRASAGLEVALNGAPVPGGVARQGYIRNSSSHTLASVHWAGLVQVTGNETLSFQMSQMAVAGEVIVQDGKQASAFIEKIDSSSGVLFSSALTVDNPDDPFNWNSTVKAPIIWESPDAISDSAAFSRGGGNTQIQVRQGGSYLLVYNDSLQSTAERPNPKITVEVNGISVPGAETKTHYIRNASPHSHATATLVFLLEDLAANDAVTVSSQMEGQTGDVNQDEFANEAATIALIRKDNFSPPADLVIAPRLSSFTANEFGFAVNYQEFGVRIDPASVTAVLDGAPVTAELSTVNNVTTISYSPSAGDILKGDHALGLSFSDTGTPPSSTQKEFTWTTLTGQTEVLLDLLTNPDDPGVAYWLFDETSGTTASEEVGNAPDGTYSSTGGGDLPQFGAYPLALSAGGSSVSFDREQGNLITIADHADINSGGPYLERTISLWFQSRNLPESGDYQVLFEEGGTTRGTSIYIAGTQAADPTEAELYLGAWNRAEEVWGGVGGDPVNANGDPLDPNGPPLFVHTTIEKGKVYNAVFVMQGDDSAPDSFNGTITGYLNGEQIGDPLPGVHLLYGHTDNNAIGAVNQNVMFHDKVVDANFAPEITQPNFFFDGLLDNIAMFPTVLSAERIKAQYDGAFDIDLPTGQPVITSLPQSQTVLEDTVATFSVEFTGSAPYEVVWFKNDEEISRGAGIGVSSGSFVAAGSDDGAAIRVDISNELGAISTEVNISVTLVTGPPTVTSIEGQAGRINQIVITFEREVEAASATSAGNYAIEGLTVSSASLSGDGKTVTLATSQQQSGTKYTVAIAGVKDTTVTGNEVTGSFSYTSIVTFADEVALDGALDHWSFGETSGTGAVNLVNPGVDGSYRSNLAGGALPTLGVDRLVIGSPSGAVALDRDQEQFIYIPDHEAWNTAPPNPVEARTVELWFRANRLPADPGDGSFTEKQTIYDEGGTTRGAMIYLSGTQTGADPTQADLYWAIWNRNGGGDGPGDPWGGFEGSDPSVNLSTTITKGEVYHVVATYLGDPDFFGKLHLYVNGEQVGETTDLDIIGLFYAHTNDGGFGARVSQGLYHDIGTVDTGIADGPADFFDGQIQEAAIYSTVLSAAQVQAHYQTGITEVPLEIGGGGDAPTITVARGVGGTIQIEFTGTLQSSPAVTGPWTDVAGGSPASIDTAQRGSQFFRAR